MTPWLPPIPGLHRRDPEHRYWLGELEFPISVTGVVGCLKSDFAMQRIEATRSHWEPRGNTTHRALELLLLVEHRLVLEDVYTEAWTRNAQELHGLAKGDWTDWIQPLITHERWASLQVIASERPTCCTRRKVAGTFDCAYIEPSLSPSPLRPDWVTGPARVLADLKTLGAAVVKWRHVAAKEWTELAEVPADTAAARLTGGRVEIRATHTSYWSFLMPATGPMAAAGDSIELRVSKPSTYSTAAQIGGYMALEATWGHHYDAGQTIWARPGQTTFGPLLSRSECLLAWAGAWATFKAQDRESGFI